MVQELAPGGSDGNRELPAGFIRSVWLLHSSNKSLTMTGLSGHLTGPAGSEAFASMVPVNENGEFTEKATFPGSRTTLWLRGPRGPRVCRYVIDLFHCWNFLTHS